MPTGDPVAQVLERLASSAEFARLKAEGPRRPAPDRPRGRMGWAPVAILGLAAWMLIGAPRSPAQPAPPVFLFFLGFVFVIVLRRRRRRRRYRAERSSVLAAHVTAVAPWSGPGQPGSLVARLQFAGGDRRRLRLPPSFPLQLEAGDFGVAFTRGDILVDFRRLSQTADIASS